MSKLGKPRRPAGWTAPGPQPVGARGDTTLLAGADEDLSYLAGDWRIFQPKSGHRWSLDDLVTAHVAVECMGGSSELRAIDMGCGLGSVLMLIAWAFPDARVTGVEAQPARAARARRSLRFNGADDRCHVIDGDLRDVGALVAELGCDAQLVVGTPPYFDEKATIPSTDPEAAACRVELRGGLEIYIAAGGALLGPDGQLVLCYPAASATRAQVAGRANELSLRERLWIVPAEGKERLIVVDRFTRRQSEVKAIEKELAVRTEKGAWTDDFRAVRRRFGMPDRPPAEAHSVERNSATVAIPPADGLPEE